MHYVGRASMWLDAWIVLLTVPRVLLAGQSHHR
jgi:lipopolysaccharide/colanic/teichoic acid biosynthesis glycosyltransferase